MRNLKGDHAAAYVAEVDQLGMAMARIASARHRREFVVMQRTGKTAMVTGASAGLGVHFARLFAREGHDVVLVARRRDKLDEVAAELRTRSGTHTAVIAADLADPQAPRHIRDEIARAGVRLEEIESELATAYERWQTLEEAGG